MKLSQPTTQRKPKREIINKGKIIRPAYMSICPARDYKPFEDR